MGIKEEPEGCHTCSVAPCDRSLEYIDGIRGLRIIWTRRNLFIRRLCARNIRYGTWEYIAYNGQSAISLTDESNPFLSLKFLLRAAIYNLFSFLCDPSTFWQRQSFWRSVAQQISQMRSSPRCWQPQQQAIVIWRWTSSRWYREWQQLMRQVKEEYRHWKT